MNFSDMGNVSDRNQMRKSSAVHVGDLNAQNEYVIDKQHNCVYVWTPEHCGCDPIVCVCVVLVAKISFGQTSNHNQFGIILPISVAQLIFNVCNRITYCVTACFMIGLKYIDMYVYCLCTMPMDIRINNTSMDSRVLATSNFAPLPYTPRVFGCAIDLGYRL